MNFVKKSMRILRREMTNTVHMTLLEGHRDTVCQSYVLLLIKSHVVLAVLCLRLLDPDFDLFPG